MNPDCRDGKHSSCSGDGWDLELDKVTHCPCTCHASGDATAQVIAEVAAERERQKIKWGEQEHPNGTGPHKLPMPYGSGSWSATVAAERLTLLTNCAAQIGQCTWLHILREEVFEAFAEEDPVKLRAELIQVAAVATQWVEAIDRSSQ
ncbi:hypothetical protein [Arthrobacter sp. HS15c]|uniref:hypothetical protein n=1 Tax=Arthrobacter sp. HS15c TaxID=3230279 RepID=UPI00346745E6